MMKVSIFRVLGIVSAVCLTFNFAAASERPLHSTTQVRNSFKQPTLRKLTTHISAWTHESKGSTVAVAVQRRGKLTNYWVKPGANGSIGFRVRSTNGVSGLKDLNANEFLKLTRELRRLPKSQPGQCKDFVAASMVAPSGRIIHRVGCLNNRSRNTLAYYRFAKRLSNVL